MDASEFLLLGPFKDFYFNSPQPKISQTINFVISYDDFFTVI